jgi:hypothetical protein
MFESWSPTLREEITVWVLENVVVRRILGLMREKIKQGWRIFQMNFTICAPPRMLFL